MPVRVTAAVVALASLFGADAGLGQGENVELSGSLLLLDEKSEPLCPELPPMRVLFARKNKNLQIPNEIGRFDRNCNWKVRGVLVEGRETLEISAEVPAFFPCVVSGDPWETIEIGPVGGEQVLEKGPVTLNLYTRRRCRDKLNAYARDAIDEGARSRAIDLYERILDEVFTDPRIGEFRADSLDWERRFREAAEAWRDVIELQKEHAPQRLAAENGAPLRWVESRYKAASESSSGDDWIKVATVAKEALDLGVRLDQGRLPLRDRSRIFGYWLDALFFAAGTPQAEYRVLHEEIRRREDLERSWLDLRRAFFEGDTSASVGLAGGDFSEFAREVGVIETQLKRKER